MLPGRTRRRSSPRVKRCSHDDIWRAGSRHWRKHGTFGLCCSIMEQNKDFSCQLEREIPICINACDINVFNDFEISHSKQIKLIKTSASFWQLGSNSPVFIQGTENWNTAPILRSHPDQEEGRGREREFAACARHQAGHCAYLSRFDPYNNPAR